MRGTLRRVWVPVLRRLRIAAGIFLVFTLLAGMASAQVRPSGNGPVEARAPMPVHTLAPFALPSPLSSRANVPGAGAQSLGSHPALFRLPPLPPKTAANTVSRVEVGNAGRRLRPMAANGDTYSISTVSGCGANSGQIYAAGCVISWKLSAAVATTDHLEDCYASNTQPNTLATCGSAYVGGGSDPGQNTTLSSSGTWVLGTLDVTTGSWLLVVYIPVGSGVYMDTFSDTFYTVQSSQFTAASGNTAYIEATGLTATDKYEFYVEYNSVAPTCIYTAPAESPAAPLTNALCNPANDTGDLTAPTGTLQIQWPLSATYKPGAYAIVLWDITSGQRLGQRQVSLNSGSVALTLTPVAGNNGSPAPAPAASAGATFAYDSNSEQSDIKVNMASSGLPTNVNVTGTWSDPTGQVVQTNSGGTGAGGTFASTFSFANAQTPSSYPLDTYTFTLLNPAGAVIASKGFRIVGYQATTEFTSPAGTAINTTNPVTTGLEFLNNGNSAYGTSNGDPISGFYFDTGAHGITITLLSGTSCGAACQTETVTDSAGVSWTITVNCTNGGNADCTLYAFPVTVGQSLAIGANLTIANAEFTGSPGNHCSNGCVGTTSILPFDGLLWSNSSQYIATNPVYFTNGASSTYSASGHIYLYGYRDSGGTLHTGKEAHGYTVRAASAGVTSVSYTANSPSSTGTAKNEYALTITNNSSGGSGNMQQIGILLPSAMSSNSANYSVDTTPPGASVWVVETCPGGQPATEICFAASGGNNGIAPAATQTIYIEAPPPTTSFGYTDVAVTTVTNPIYGISADSTWQVFDSTTNPATVDSTAIVGYSLNSALMSVATSPTSIGTNTTQTVGFTVTNTGTGNDANPDLLDAVIIAVPTANTLSGISVSTTGWSELGSFVVGANTDYVFGLCATQNNILYEPPNDGMPSCGTAVEQAGGLAPGASLNFSASMVAGAASGSVNMNLYAHGANGNGWSAAKAFSETVTPISVNAGFSAAGMIGSPTTFSNGTLPTVGADSSPTLGNAFVYTISNTSSSGPSNNVTSVTIVVPGKDVSGNNGSDSSGQAWQITAAPTLSGSGFSGCGVTSYTSATAGGADGSIVIGGGACALTPGGTMNVNFDAKSPYKINDTYRFTSSANAGAVVVSEAWVSDTEMEVILSASLSITTDPAINATDGTNPAPNCPPCAFTASSIDFGTIANPGSQLGTDVATVDVTTDATSPVGWTLYVSASANPANTGGTYLNEFVGDVDSAHSISGAGVTYDQSSLMVIPTTTPGLKLVDTGSGTTARRNPFGLVMNYEIYINGGVTTGQTPTVTYTFIAN